MEENTNTNGGSEEENKAKEKEGSAKWSLYQIARNWVAIAFICGLTQLFSFLGAGGKDPFFGGDSELTILQTTGCMALLSQFAVFVPSYIFQTEKFYDITGSATYYLCTLYTLFAGAKDNNGEFKTRAIATSVLVLIWCSRMGYFLFNRVLKVGKDVRFEQFKNSFSAFLAVWLLQGLWIFLTGFCAFIINSDQSDASSEENLQVSDIVGIMVWIIGFTIEAISDFQKQRWREAKKASDSHIRKHDFIDYGFWYYSRHPNYFGEILLWFGIFILSLEVLDGRQFSAVCSPIFVYILLRFISGVPILEKSSDKKFGNLEEYQEYKRTTSVLVPLPKGWTFTNSK